MPGDTASYPIYDAHGNNVAVLTKWRIGSRQWDRWRPPTCRQTIHDYALLVGSRLIIILNTRPRSVPGWVARTLDKLGISYRISDSEDEVLSIPAEDVQALMFYLLYSPRAVGFIESFRNAFPGARVVGFLYGPVEDSHGLAGAGIDLVLGYSQSSVAELTTLVTGLER